MIKLFNKRLPSILTPRRCVTVNMKPQVNLQALNNFRLSFNEKLQVLEKILEDDQLNKPGYLSEVQRAVGNFIANNMKTFSTGNVEQKLLNSLESLKNASIKRSDWQSIEAFIQLSMALSYNAKITNNDYIENNLILKKIIHLLSNAEVSEIGRNMTAIYQFGEFCKFANRSDVNDMIVEKADFIFDTYRSFLDLPGKLALIEIFSKQKTEVYQEKCLKLIHLALGELADISLDDFCTLTAQIYGESPSLLDAWAPKLERKAMLLIASYDVPPSDFIRVVLVISPIALEDFWEKITLIIFNTISFFNPNQKCELLYMFASSVRGSDDLLSLFYAEIAKDFDKLDEGGKLRLFFSQKRLNFNYDPIDFNDLQKEIFDVEFIHELLAPEAILLLENTLAFESLPDQSRNLVLKELEDIAENKLPEIQEAYANMVEAYIMAKAK